MPQNIINMILLGTASVMTLFFLIWVVHIFLKNAGVVDVGWGLGFILLCAIYIINGEGFNLRNIIYFIMVIIWGLRISLFLLKRLANEKSEDRRYQKMRNDWGSNTTIKFLFFFLFQAILEVIISAPFIVVSVNSNPSLSIFEVLGIIIFAVSLIGETVADEQLHSFKSNEANKGKTCDVGLWYYSRHPNYFFEWMVWMGLFVYALGSPFGWISFVSPLVMFYLIIYVSGVPLAEEQAYLSRGEEYRKYQQTTSMFFPMPKKVRSGS